MELNSEKLLMENMQVAKAFMLASHVHRNQKDKAGVPYIYHPVAVASRFSTPLEQTAALLHDVIEDGDVDPVELLEDGYDQAAVNAVLCLTMRPGETRAQYLRRVASDPLAIRVKLADLAHNSDIRRIPRPTRRDYDRVEKYAGETSFLLEKLREHEQGNNKTDA